MAIHLPLSPKHTFQIIRAFALFTIIILASTPALADLEIPVWCYYNEPPFAIGQDQGLEHDIVNLLNEESKGQFTFYLVSMSRKRLDTFLKAGRTGIALFVSPIWMEEKGKANFLWSPPLLHDKNEIVSRKSSPVNYSGPESVYGLTIAGVHGHKYKDLDSAVAQGKIKRRDAKNMALNLRTVIENHGNDFTTIPKSTLGYLLLKFGYKDKAYISPTPLAKYTRHLLLNNPSPKLKKFIFNFVAKLKKNKKWRKIKDTYQIH
jgi:polar amino acid transport system substrate-binding protein